MMDRAVRDSLRMGYLFYCGSFNQFSTGVIDILLNSMDTHGYLQRKGFH